MPALSQPCPPCHSWSCLPACPGRAATPSPELFDAIAVWGANQLADFQAKELVALAWGYSRIFGRGLAPRGAHSDTEAEVGAGDESRAAEEPRAGGLELSPACDELLRQLAEELAGRSTELSETEAVSAASSFRRMQLPEPFSLPSSMEDGAP